MSGGKYHEEAVALLAINEAEIAIVMIQGGRRGPGFAVAAQVGADIPRFCKAIRGIIDQMEADYSTDHAKHH